MVVRRAAELGTVLGVWGHPDDEAYLSGGLMADAVDAGSRVVCVTATKGEAGFPDDDPRSVDERMAVREAELAACLDVLRVREHRWLPYRDGWCDRVPNDEAVAKLCAIMDEVQPDTVLTFGPEGQTGHVDHIAASRWTTLAFREAAPATARLFYATQTPDWNATMGVLFDVDEIMMVKGMELPSTDPDDLAIWMRLDDGLLDRKVRALRSQASQVDGLVERVGEAAYRDMARDEFFRAPLASDWPE
jgi:LmbE family N-acetylglucosaminyl deacetylase